jgi:hypothetical protein
MKLNGRFYTKRDILSRVGRIEQLGGVRRYQFSEGREAGVEQIEVRTGAGLRYLVSPSRALDISLAEFGGVPLSWQSMNGDVHPAYFDARGIAWLRTAVGGLLMTCGLSSVGAASEDAGEALGIHGCIHHLPARHLAVEGTWNGDEYDIRIAGKMEEARIFGENLHLHRTIRSRLGENRIAITDVVENKGFAETPLMFLYHFNFGFPLMDEHTHITFPSETVVARDAGVPIAGYDTWQAPDTAMAERVYYHEDLIGSENGRLTATIHNPHFPTVGGERPLSLHLSWNQQQLPKLVQWKMAGAGTYVLGIEPANCTVAGRARERQQGTLQFIQPGESKPFDLVIDIVLHPGFEEA